MTTLDQMWERLAEHQPFADERGCGPEWKRMCEERTLVAATAAWYAVPAADCSTRAAAGVARFAMMAEDTATRAAAEAESRARQAIEHIEQAEGRS